MKKGVIRWIVVILILLVVVLVYGKKSGWFGTDLEQVEIATVETTSIDQLVSATGKIYPETEIKLSSEVSGEIIDRKSTRLNSSHVAISYAVFCLKKKI